MANSIKILTVLAVFAAGITACDINNQLNPNQPSPEGFTQNPTANQLNLLVVGSLAQMRAELGTYIDAVGVVGREHYRFSGSDPRFVGDLLGAGGGVLDNNAFYTTNPHAARYATVKNTNLIIEGATNTTSATVSETGRQGYLGFAKTIKANELLMVLNQQFNNGIRVDVADPDDLGPLLSYDQSLEAIAGLLDEAAAHFDSTGTEFAFALTSGFADFNTPASFRQVNRGLAARVAVYRENWDQALTFLDESFLDLTGNLDEGVYHTFSGNAGDQLNPLFIARNAAGDLRTAHPAWLSEAESGDTRLADAFQRNAPFSNAGLTGTHDVFKYTSNTDNVPIIRNGELILIFAEASIQRNQGTDLADAEDALNVVRNAAGLSDYTGASTQAALIDEMLNQRRYELWFEGHRWVDMRRYDRLDELTIDRPGDIVHVQFPLPFNEREAM